MNKTPTSWKIVVFCSAFLPPLLNSAAAHAQAQHLADPSYFYPGAIWTKLEAASPTAGLAIINPNSGSGAAINSDYAAQVTDAKAHGIKVIGYVDTAYGKRSMDLVKADIDNFYSWYHVDGILFDEASNHEEDVPYYKSCADLVRAHTSTSLVVLNPGAPTQEDYMAFSDIIITFESPYAQYVTNFVQYPWMTHYPASRFWHIVLGVTTEAQMRDAIAKSKQRNAGWVFVTPYAPPANPYDKLPDEPYWSDELKAIGSYGG